MPPLDREGVTASADLSLSGGRLSRCEGEAPRRTVSLGGGLVVPYPEPANASATRVGRANRRKDTGPEVRLRSTLHGAGLRFRKDHLLRLGRLGVRPDIVFTRQRIAVFVDGCFWHGCAAHQRVPKRNVDYWSAKLQSNRDRDRRVDAALSLAGWDVVRVWEHEELTAAASRIAEVVRHGRGQTRV